MVTEHKFGGIVLVDRAGGCPFSGLPSAHSLGGQPRFFMLKERYYGR